MNNVINVNFAKRKTELQFWEERRQSLQTMLGTIKFLIETHDENSAKELQWLNDQQAYFKNQLAIAIATLGDVQFGRLGQ